MGVPPSDRDNGRGGSAGGGELHCPKPEQSCTVHCNQDHYGPVSGVKATPRDNGVKAVVIAGELWSRVDMVGGMGGKGRKQLREYSGEDTYGE